MSEIHGRHEDPTPIKCEECGWEGQAKDAIHTYTGTGVYITDSGQPDEDVEPVDECPECGSENLVSRGEK